MQSLSPEHKPDRLSANHAAADPFSGALRCPGLTPRFTEITPLAASVLKGLAVLRYKHRHPALWIAFMGGTGTGKSSLFNALCGRSLSASGVERPKTGGPVAYAHQDFRLEEGFPIPGMQVTRVAAEKAAQEPAHGSTGEILVWEHTRTDWSRFVFLDTPDLDSVEAAHREMVSDLFRLTDAVVFVSSPEKYADQIPARYLKKVTASQKLCYFLLNKSGPENDPHELESLFRRQEIPLKPERIRQIEAVPAPVAENIAKSAGFQAFSDQLQSDLNTLQNNTQTQERHGQSASHLKKELAQLKILVSREEHAAGDWLLHLDRLQAQIGRELIESEKVRFASQSQKYIQAEIRNLFTRYDPLAKPRLIIRGVLQFPLRLLGFGPSTPESRRHKALEVIKRQIDPAPVIRAAARFNRNVLETLSPENESAPLFQAIRTKGLPLSDEEIRARLLTEHNRLGTWVEERFETLSAGIPRHKKWGIYSTSVMWGILLIAIETAVGGGFTALDAIVDSALAPFVTKGAMELFAYQEIRNIAHGLSNRYQEGLLAILKSQHDRYAAALAALGTDTGHAELFSKIESEIESMT